MSAPHHTTDVVIIGAGPVGLFAVFECGMLKLRCHVVDTLDMVGGQCAALYPEKPIYDIPGSPAVMAGDLIDNLMEQAEPFDPVFHLDQQVTAVEEQGERFVVTTSRGVSIDAGAVIIAAGAGAFGPNKPPMKGLDAYEETGAVQYYIRRRKDFEGKRLVIAGGGDSAVDWAISLSELAESVQLVHRRPKFRCAPESLARMKALEDSGKVELVVPYQLKGIHGTDGQIEAVEVATLKGESRMLECDHLLPFYGLAMTLGPIADWGLGLERNHIAIDPLTAATNRPGIYAIGDIATYQNKLKLILTGFAESAQAAHHIWHRLNPGEALHFEYSTTKGVPAEE
ncbi:MAG: NAD(P)/FAD-dependent oxidoreductase [Alphaproteobacteria bacterium]